MNVILITGASGGIGTSLVESFTSSGWSVIATDRPSITPSKYLLNLCLGWIPADLSLFP